MGKFSDLRQLRSTGRQPALRSLPFIAAILLISVSVTAFRIPYFTRFSTDDGLSQNTVFSICQDSSSFIWFGTMDGLSRYDGYEFKVWRHVPGDSTSLSSDIVRHVFTDACGRVWAGTSEGLSLYDPLHESFRTWRTGDVRGLVTADDGGLYVASASGLDVLDPVSGARRAVALGTGVVPSTIARGGNTLWIATDGSGLLRLDIAGGELKKVPEFSSPCRVCAIYPFGDSLWLATEGDGLWCLEIDGASCVRTERFTRRDALPSDYVRSIETDDCGRLWVGTYGGLCILEDGVFNPVSSDASEEGGLSQKSVRSICRDSQGGMWLGTYFGGVNYYHPLKNHFRSFHRGVPGKSLNDNVVNCLSEDSKGRLWIGTNSGGVNCWDISTGNFRYWSLKKNDGSAPEPYDVKALYVDDARGQVYVGAHAGGLSRIDMRSGSIVSLPAQYPIVPKDVYSIIGGPASSLWLGTLDGIFSYDRESGHFSSAEYVSEAGKYRARSAKVLLLDSRSRLWSGGEDGLSVFMVLGDGRLVPEDVSAPEGLYVQSLLEIPGRFLWVGTRDGLWRHDFASGEWRRFSISDGLPGNIVGGLCSDIYDMIWISTDKGISRFNPFSSTFRNFTKEDGLSGNSFNQDSSLRRRSGEILFGGPDGITAFNPELLSDNPYAPSPCVTDFRLTGKYAGEQVRPTDGVVRLSHDRNSFAISFSVPNYLSGHQNRFSYILEGHDDSWTETSSQRTASWSNLPHGKYVFRLKAANNDGKWCSVPLSIRIVIRPVWYETIPAIIAFTLLLILFVVGAFLLMARSKDRQRQFELAQQEKVHQEELQQMKTRFFINISHEMRTPLMLIVNPLSEMISRTNDLWMRRQLKLLDRNARRLLRLVNQIIDYRRAELGVFRLSVRKEPVMKIIRENWTSYESLAHKKKLRFRLDSKIGDETALVDVQYLELILNNLLSNAFKYTEEGSVTVSAALSPDELVISVSDTGVGIPKEHQEDIFERFYQVERDYVGSGIGLSLVKRLVELHHGRIELESAPGEGSTFTIHLPQSVSAYSPEELGETSEGQKASGRDVYFSENEESEAEESLPVEETPSGDEPGGSLLIVEDNAEIASYLRESLSEDFEIRLASNGEQALESIREAKPDVVITDLNMPVMDGLKLCTRLKQNVATSDIPVIVISSSTDTKDQLNALRSGADDYISKPFPLNVLNAKIRNMLRTRARAIDNLSKAPGEDSSHLGMSAYDEHLLAKATAIVEKNMDNAEFSTADFAEQMGMSRSNLHLKLKALTGESALDFIRRIRFKEACRLLKDGRYSISAISDLVGFSSPSYFASCFKRYMGCLPTEWGREKK